MTLTTQTILDAAAVIGQGEKVGLYSARLFPGRNTTSFKGPDGEVFHVAAPEFWERLAVDVAPSIKVALPNRTLWGRPIIDLDADLTERKRVMGVLLAILERGMPKRPVFPARFPPA